MSDIETVTWPADPVLRQATGQLRADSLPATRLGSLEIVRAAPGALGGNAALAVLTGPRAARLHLDPSVLSPLAGADAADHPDLREVLLLWVMRHQLAAAHLMAGGVRRDHLIQPALADAAAWSLVPQEVPWRPAEAVQMRALDAAHGIGLASPRPRCADLREVLFELDTQLRPSLGLDSLDVRCVPQGTLGEALYTVVRTGDSSPVILLDHARIVALSARDLREGEDAEFDRRDTRRKLLRDALTRALASAYLFARGFTSQQVDPRANQAFTHLYTVYGRIDAEPLAAFAAEHFGPPAAADTDPAEAATT